jgi:hypothetical protein
VDVGAADSAKRDLDPDLLRTERPLFELGWEETAIRRDRNRSHDNFRTFSNASSARSRCSRLWLAITLVRISERPRGTAG